MGSHRDQGVSHAWPGGSEHGIMDASFYLDDLLRNMAGNITEVEPAGATRGSQLQTPVSPLSLQAFAHPVQTIPMRRPSPFPLGSLPPSQARGVSAPVPKRLMVPQQQHQQHQQQHEQAVESSRSEEEEDADDDDWTMSSGAPSEATNSQSLITHRSARSDPGIRSNKRGRSALPRNDDHARGRQGSLVRQQRRRSSPRVSWKDGRAAGAEEQRGGSHVGGGQEESEEDEGGMGKKGKKGGGGGNREAVRKYRAKKKAQAREMELQLEQLRRENAVLQRRAGQHGDLAREVVALRSLVVQLYQRLGETPPTHLQQAAAEAGHTADSDKPMAAMDMKMMARGTLARPPSPPSLLPTGNSSTLANVVLAERSERMDPVPTLAQAALPDFPGSDWLAAMSTMDNNANSTLTALPHQQNTLGFSYQNAALLPNRLPLHSTIQEGLAFSAPSEHQDFGARFDSSD